MKSKNNTSGFSLLGAVILRFRVLRLCRYLRKKGIECGIRGQFRSKATAHRWSTAYHIVNGFIKLSELRKLREGRDNDGNLWYRPEWGSDLPDNTIAAIIPEIKTNAQILGQRRSVFAAEGYDFFDPRRQPNLSTIPVSSHIGGLAIDVKLDWDKLGGAWSDEACGIVEKFGLRRPIQEEHWHLELSYG